MFCSVVDFAFRAAEAESGHLRTTKFWVNYLQSVYAMSFISIAGDLSNIARVYLLTTARGSDPSAPSDLLPETEPEQGQSRAESVDTRPKPFDSEIALMGGVQGQMGTFEVLPEEPKRQAVFNRFALVTLSLRLPALALGGVYGGVYFAGTKDQGNAVLSQQMRCGLCVHGAWGTLVLTQLKICLGHTRLGAPSTHLGPAGVGIAHAPTACRSPEGPLLSLAVLASCEYQPRC